MFSLPSHFYAMADPQGLVDRTHVDIGAELIAAGARIVQIRAKQLSTAAFVEQARALRKLTREASALLIVNDRADIARLVDADGVHLGQDDLPVEAARAILGNEKIVGLSTHSLAQARQAQEQGIADYIGFGPIFPTLSKNNPDPVQGLRALAEVRAAVRLPIVAIGGITLDQIPEVLQAGADAVAIIRAITHAADIQRSVREILALRA